ncbi:MAG: hypothetical protein Ct9H300mP12_04060 [Acidimicrobiales bacterium]|nr:MAG: hypothetical protein Ct9H300mP12_04060 [Acidimicrobiales bacterium]
MVRADGYHQDRASQLVVEAVLTARVGGVPGHGGERILDLCAAPGGKATALAASGPGWWPATSGSDASAWGPRIPGVWAAT